MTEKETGQLLAYLAAAWPRFEIHKGALAVYFEQFKDSTAGEMKAAVDNFIEHSTHGFPPSIPELKSCLKHIEKQKVREATIFKSLPYEVEDTRERREAIVASCRNKLDALYYVEPKEEDDDIVAGCEDQRYIRRN